MKADVIKWDLYSGGGAVKSKNAFIGFMELLHENGHELLSEYVNSRTKVLINFNCGHDPHWISPDSYKRGVRCPKCYGRCPKQAEEEFLNLLRRNNHESLTEYINDKTKVLINFNCGHEPHWVSPNNYKSGNRCPKCYGNCPKQAEEEFLNLLRRNNHKLLSEYINNTTKVLINFNCGHEPHWVCPNHYKKGIGCPKCYGRCPKQAEEEFLNLLRRNNHESLTEYINNKTKVLINFNCGHEPHWVIPNSYKSGKRCPKCKFSKGEKVILDYLTENEFNVVSQYRIDGYNYKYDIYIREYNLIVEVHGRQHYEEVVFFGRRTLEEERMNDYEKEKLAVSKGYNYMAIDYKEHKPELALERFKEQFRFYETKQPKLEVFL